MPVFALSIMIFLKEAVIESTSLFSNQEISAPIPFYYNLPLKALTSLKWFVNVTDCDEWYGYSFNKQTTTYEDEEFIGWNEGLPMRNPESGGMLSGGDKMLSYPC